MAGSAWHTCMTAAQREGSIIVVKGYIPPAAGSMTGCAVCTKLTIMPVIVCVTGIAVLRRTFEDAINMTTDTLKTDMTAPQGECCIAEVKGDIPPTGGRMACGAVRAELTCMRIIRGMAGETILWGAAQNSILMAGCTLHIGVTASQWEGRGVVIEDDVLPAARIVAPGTKRTKLTLMGVLRLMA